MNDLPRYTWDQAEILGLYPPQAFEAFQIASGTVRRWASEGHIQQAGIGPNGTRLYAYADVLRHAQDHGWRPRHRVRIH